MRRISNGSLLRSAERGWASVFWSSCKSPDMESARLRGVGIVGSTISCERFRLLPCRPGLRNTSKQQMQGAQTVHMRHLDVCQATVRRQLPVFLPAFSSLLRNRLGIVALRRSRQRWRWRLPWRTSRRVNGRGKLSDICNAAIDEQNALLICRCYSSGVSVVVETGRERLPGVIVVTCGAVMAPLSGQPR